ncbi:HTH domain-containing protein [Pseudonocardia sp. ICBG1142]
MTPTRPWRARRKHSARTLAEQLNVSDRTIRNTVAEERADYEERSRQRRAQIIARSESGKSPRDIANELQISLSLTYSRIAEQRRVADSLVERREGEDDGPLGETLRVVR